MITTELFISDLARYDFIRRELRTTFNLDSSLPKQVFNCRYSRYVCEEFDWAMTGGFWEMLKMLSEVNGDSSIFLSVLNPDPITYYYTHFNTTNWVQFPVEFTEKMYCEALKCHPMDSIPDAIAYNSYTVAWIGTSKRWAVWGDRNFGICILAFRDDAVITKELCQMIKSWMSIEEASLSLLQPYLRGNLKMGKQVLRLVRNYGAKALN